MNSEWREKLREKLREKMTLLEVAAMADIHLSTVGRWVTYGVRGRKLRSVMVGGRRYVLPSDLDLFLEQGTEEKLPPAASYPEARTTESCDAAGRELASRFGL